MSVQVRTSHDPPEFETPARTVIWRDVHATLTRIRTCEHNQFTTRERTERDGCGNELVTLYWECAHCPLRLSSTARVGSKPA